MNTIVIKANQKQKQAILAAYASQQVPSKNAYIEAFFKLDDVSISVYTSGKVMFQGEQAEKEAQKWGAVADTPTSTAIQQNQAILGTDEVGNGSYFGGLAVVACFVTPADHAWLQSLGVGDSKTLTDQKIRQLAPLLKENIPHQPLLLTPYKYNEVIEQGYNAVSVKVALHNQAIYLLLQKGIEPDAIVIDAFTSLKNYQRYVAQEKNQINRPVHLEEKAEGKYLAVAVSSIIARSLFLDNLEQLGQEIGFDLPSGAGAKSDQVASRILAKHGLSGLHQTAKLHFANTQKAAALLKQ